MKKYDQYVFRFKEEESHTVVPSQFKDSLRIKLENSKDKRKRGKEKKQVEAKLIK